MSTRPDARDELQDPQLAKWYRESGGPEPGEALDRAILAAARREVHARPHAAGSLMRRWRVPLSLAAVVVLSVTVVTLVREQEGDLAELSAPPRLEERAVRAPEALPPQPAQEAGSKAAHSAGQKPAAPDASPVLPPKAVAPPPSVPPATPPAPAPRGRTDKGASPLKDVPGARPAQGEPAAAAEAPPAATGTLSAATPSPAPGTAPESREREDVRRAEAARDEVSRGPTGAAKVGDVHVAPAAPAAQARPPEEPAASAPSAVRKESAATESRSMARLQAPRQPAPPAEEVAQLLKALDKQPPERWLEKIEELRRAGRIAASDELLAEFRKRFPAHPGPTMR